MKTKDVPQAPTIPRRPIGRNNRLKVFYNFDFAFQRLRYLVQYVQCGSVSPCFNPDKVCRFYPGRFG